MCSLCTTPPAMPSSEQDSAAGYNIAAFSASFSAKRCLDSDSKNLHQEGGERDNVPRQPKLRRSSPLHGEQQHC